MKMLELNMGSELYNDALDLRYDLFFKKHKLPREILIDEYESRSKHIVLVRDESLIAYGRLTKIDQEICRISQVVVKPAEQGKGYGTKILHELVKQAEKSGCEKITLNARATAMQLYEKLGFTSNGQEFLSKSTGVPHVQMLYISNKI